MPRKILQTGAGFTALSILASGLNFLFYPVIARLLNTAQYGEVQIGVAFIMQAAALFTSLNILALFFAAQKEDLRELTLRLERFVIFMSVVLAAITFLLAVPIAHVLQLADPRLLYILSLIFILNIPGATWLGALQGGGQFVASGAISTISSLLKIVVAVVAVKLGWGAYGALFGILIGTAAILPMAYTMQKQKVITFRGTFARVRLHDLRLFIDHPTTGLVFLSLFILAITSTLDVVFAKSNLSPVAAGAYAQLSTAAKIPYFAAVPLAIILFERFIKNPATIRKACFLFAGFTLLAAASTFILRRLVVDTFFNYHTYSPATFGLLLGAFVCYACTTLLVYALLSRQHVKRAFAASGFTLMSACLVGFAASSPKSIALWYFSSQCTSLIIAVGLQYSKSHV